MGCGLLGWGSVLAARPVRGAGMSYHRRSQVENVNGMLRINGGLSHGSCRAKGIGAHIFTALALAVAHNLNLQRTDPLAAKPTSGDDDDSGDDDATGGDAPAPTPDSSPSTDPSSGQTLRAPP